MKFDFDPALHVYRLDGRPIPSTTQVLGAVGLSPDFSKVNRSVLEHRRQLGSALSVCLQFLQQGDLDSNTIDPEVAPLLEAHKLFVADTGFRPDPDGIELRRWPTVRGMAWGMCLDVKGLREKEPWILDWKISEGTPKYAWAIQTASYEMGIPAPLVPPFRYRRATVQLFENGRYNLKEWDCKGDRDEWLWSLWLVYQRINRGEAPWDESGRPA